jgi:hypothetical protein
VGKVLLVILSNGCRERAQGRQDGVGDSKGNLRFWGERLGEVNDEVLVTAVRGDAMISQEFPMIPVECL